MFGTFTTLAVGSYLAFVLTLEYMALTFAKKDGLPPAPAVKGPKNKYLDNVKNGQMFLLRSEKRFVRYEKIRPQPAAEKGKAPTEILVVCLEGANAGKTFILHALTVITVFE